MKAEHLLTTEACLDQIFVRNQSGNAFLTIFLPVNTSTKLIQLIENERTEPGHAMKTTNRVGFNLSLLMIQIVSTEPPPDPSLGCVQNLCDRITIGGVHGNGSFDSNCLQGCIFQEISNSSIVGPSSLNKSIGIDQTIRVHGKDRWCSTKQISSTNFQG
jgi:hypothetical protein